MTPKVAEVLDKLVEHFESGNIPEAVAFSMFPIPNLPCTKWSLLNRTMVYLSGSFDARGFKQWKNAGRYVKKGAKAVYIMIPLFRKPKEEEEKEDMVLYGFGVSPVFKAEDTDGEELEYEDMVLPDLPLMDKAKEWGIDTKAVPNVWSCYGFYSPKENNIGLATPAEKVFFHELAHAAHHKIKGKMENGQDPIQEIVAELSAAALCRIVGKAPEDTSGNSYQYIKRYAEELKLDVRSACLTVMKETEKVLNLILGIKKEASNGKD